MGDIMTCKINADTSDGLKLISDTSGAVDIQSNGTTKVTIDANGNVNTVGQVSTTDNGTIVTRQNAKPLIINGDMQVAQRGTSTTGITVSTIATCDRINQILADNGTWTNTQDSDTPTGQGFAHSWKLDNTTADTSVASASKNFLSYKFEGQDVQLFKKGTSNATYITLAFWIKTTVTGTYIAELYDSDNTRAISQAYTVTDSNTWEKKVLSFVGDTTGAFDNDNAQSLVVNIWFGAGSNFTSGTLATSWASATNANRAVGQVNGASSTDNNIYITGLQLEVGQFTSSTIPSFQFESYGDSLARCFRYFEHNHRFGVVQIIGYACGGVPFSVQKRVSPTLTFYAGISGAGTAGSLVESESSGAAKVVHSASINISGISRIRITSSGITNTTMSGSFDAAAEL